MRNKERIVNAFKDIKTTNELTKRIFAKTVEKKDGSLFIKRRMPKFAMVLLISFAIGTLGCGAVFAKDYIASYILKRQSPTEEFNDQYALTLLNPVKIKDNASLNCDDILPIDEIEKELKISLLGHGEKFNVIFTNNMQLCNINQNIEEDITDVNIRAFNIYNFSNEKSVEMGVRFFTNNASKEIIDKYKNIPMVTSFNEGKIELEKRYIKNLDTFGYYFDMSMGHFHPAVSVNFVYNNMYYDFYADNMTQDELHDFLENIK